MFDFWVVAVVTRGASPKKRKAAKSQQRIGKISWRFLFASFSFIGLIVLAVFSLNQIQPLKIIREYTNKPIASISIQGEFKYISQGDIEVLVAQKLTNTFLELDIMALKGHLESHPWIDRAVVARQWPDTLLIKVREQQPIARWNNKGFLNLRGEIVNLSNKTELNHLPLLRANDRYTKRVMQQYVLIVKLLSEYKFAPLVLELDNTLSWSLVVSPAIIIRLGREDTIEKLQRLMRVLQGDLKNKVNQMAAVDMRYQQGFAISWSKDTVLEGDTIGAINNQ